MVKNKDISAASKTLLTKIMCRLRLWHGLPDEQVDLSKSQLDLPLHFFFLFFHLVHVHVKDIWTFHHAKEDYYLWLGFSIKKGSSAAVELEEGPGEPLIFRPNPGTYG